MAQLIDGKAVAAQIGVRVTQQVALLRQRGVSVRLVSVMVGSPQAGEVYQRSQANRCAAVGIEYDRVVLPEGTGLAEVQSSIARLNADPQVHGIMLNLPLPAGMDEPAVQYCIDPHKDVEGVNPANIGFAFYGRPIMAPCTALSVLEILRHIGLQLKGRQVVVVGQGAIVGRPVTLFLLQEESTVTACHAATRDLARHTAAADVLIVAVGKPGLITGDMVKPQAVVIDVGINHVARPSGDIIVGDVDFASVEPVASHLTPVPGGVGPITVAILLRNTVEAARKQLREQ